VLQWLTFCNTELQKLTDDKLFQLNRHLVDRTFVATSHLSLADLLVFSCVSGAVASLPSAQTDQLCNLLRWYDLVQSTTAAASIFGRVSVQKPWLNSAPILEPAQAPQSKSSGSSSTAAAAPKPEKRPQTGADAKPSEGAASAAAKAECPPKGKPDSSSAAGAPEPEKRPPADKAAKDKPSSKKQEAEVSVAMADIRVGTIVKVWRHPNADALYCEEIDVGEEKPRQVVSGLVKFVPEDGMINRRVVVVCNLKPAKMREVMSYGMVLCASNEAHDKVEPLAPPQGVPNGERVRFEGFDGEPEEVLNPKKKVWDKIAADLTTNSEGVAQYKDSAFLTSQGPCTASIAGGTVN